MKKIILIATIVIGVLGLSALGYFVVYPYFKPESAPLDLTPVSPSPDIYVPDFPQWDANDEDAPLVWMPLFPNAVVAEHEYVIGDPMPADIYRFSTKDPEIDGEISFGNTYIHVPAGTAVILDCEHGEVIKTRGILLGYPKEGPVFGSDNFVPYGEFLGGYNIPVGEYTISGEDVTVLIQDEPFQGTRNAESGSNGTTFAVKAEQYILILGSDIVLEKAE